MFENSFLKAATAGIFISAVFASPSIAQPELGKDNGKKPWAVNIEKLTAANDYVAQARRGNRIRKT